jgi:hypothetical protein
MHVFLIIVVKTVSAAGWAETGRQPGAGGRRRADRADQHWQARYTGGEKAKRAE